MDPLARASAPGASHVAVMVAVCGAAVPSGGVEPASAAAAAVETAAAAAATSDIAATALVVPVAPVAVESVPPHYNGADVDETDFHRLDAHLAPSFLKPLQLLPPLDYNLAV